MDISFTYCKARGFWGRLHGVSGKYKKHTKIKEPLWMVFQGSWPQTLELGHEVQ